MPKASQFKKLKEDERSSYPSGHVAKPINDSKKPLKLSDKNRVVFAEEPNRDDG